MGNLGGHPGARGGQRPRPHLDSQVGPRSRVAPGLWVAPQAALWSPGAFRQIKILRKFSAQSDDISCDGLSEIQKEQKQETGTRHLVNRLVRQNP